MNRVAVADICAEGDRMEHRFLALQGLAGLERIATEWQRLAETIPQARFNHFPGWYRAHLASGMSDPARVWFIAAYGEGRQLRTVFPLQFQRRTIRFLHPRLLGTLDDDELQLSDFIFAPTAANATLVYELTGWLRSQRTLRWDQLRLLKIPQDSLFAYSARTRLHGTTLAEIYDSSAYFETSGTYEHATRHTNSKFRSNLRRRVRLAEQSAPLRFQAYRRLEELDEGFRLFLDVEASGWKGRAGTSSAIRCRPSVLAFYSELVREFGPQGECVINILWHGEQAIAGQFALRIGRTLHILKIGYQDSLSQLAPGIVLHDMTLRHACTERDIDIVSLVNNPPWARSFKPLTHPVWIYRTPNWTVRGLLVQAGLLARRTWKKQAPQTQAAAEE
jgi:CelD/BcsL family acetyltransferase involved in cellulose biosynthesis